MGSRFQSIKTQLKTLIEADATLMGSGTDTKIDRVFDYWLEAADRCNVWIDMKPVQVLQERSSTGIYTEYTEMTIRVNVRFGSIPDAENNLMDVVQRMLTFLNAAANFIQTGYWCAAGLACPKQNEIPVKIIEPGAEEDTNMYCWRAEFSYLFENTLNYA